jgi:hypothetical protein
MLFDQAFIVVAWFKALAFQEEIEGRRFQSAPVTYRRMIQHGECEPRAFVMTAGAPYQATSANAGSCNLRQIDPTSAAGLGMLKW